MEKAKVFNLSSESFQMGLVHTPTESVKSKGELNIYKLARPIYLISRICGLFPFSLQYNNDTGELEKVVVTMFDKIWFALSLGRYCLLSYLSVALSLNHHMNESYVFLYSAGNFILCLGLILGGFSICNNMIQRELLLRSLHDLHACDKDLQALGVKINYQKQKRIVILTFGVFFTSASVFIAITAYAYRAYHIPSKAFIMTMFYASYASQTFMVLANVLIYTFELLTLRHRYKLLNELIRFGYSSPHPDLSFNLILIPYDTPFRVHFLRERKIEPIILNDWKSAEFVQHLSRLHDHLNDVMDEINACWSVQVMMKNKIM